MNIRNTVDLKNTGLNHMHQLKNFPASKYSAYVLILQIFE